MDIEALLRKAEQDGCMVVLNDIAPNRERSELVFRVPESVYDTPVAALDIDESTKSALQRQKITVLEHLLHRLAVGKNAAKQLHIAQDAAEQVVNAVIETAYRRLSEVIYTNEVGGGKMGENSWIMRRKAPNRAWMR